MNSSKLPVLAILVLLSVSFPALAYVGPGAGITLIGAVIGLFTAIFVAIFAVLRWPIRRYLARRKAAAEAAKPVTPDAGAAK
jgi:type VI protein secretion system component VasK